MEAIPGEGTTKTKRSGYVYFALQFQKRKACKQKQTTHLVSLLLEEQVRGRVWPEEKFNRHGRIFTDVK